MNKIIPGSGSVADLATINVWKYFRGDLSMPEDFFGDVFDLKYGRASFRGKAAPDFTSCDCYDQA